MQLKASATNNGFQSALVMCGNVVNQDASIGATFTTPEAEEVRLRGSLGYCIAC